MLRGINVLLVASSLGSMQMEFIDVPMKRVRLFGGDLLINRQQASQGKDIDAGNVIDRPFIR